MLTSPSRICTVVVLGLGLAIAPAVTATAATPETPSASASESAATARTEPVANVGLGSGSELSGTGALGATVSVVDATGKKTTIVVPKLGEWTTSVKGFTAPLSITQTRFGAVSKAVTFGAQRVQGVRLISDAVVGKGTPSAVVILRDANGERRTAAVGPTGSWSVPSKGLTAPLQIRERILSQTSKPVAFGAQPAPVEVSYRAGDHLIGTGADHATVTVDDATGKSVTSTVVNGYWDVAIAGLAGPLEIRQTLLGLDSATITYGDRPAAPEVSYRAGDRLIGTGARFAVVTATDATGKTATATVDYDRWDLDLRGLTGPLEIRQALLDIESEATVYGGRPAPVEVSYRAGDRLVGTGDRFAVVTVSDGAGTTATGTVDHDRWVIDVSALRGPLSVKQTLLGLDSDEVVFTG